MVKKGPSLGLDATIGARNSVEIRQSIAAKQQVFVKKRSLNRQNTDEVTGNPRTFKNKMQAEAYRRSRTGRNY